MIVVLSSYHTVLEPEIDLGFLERQAQRLDLRNALRLGAREFLGSQRVANRIDNSFVVRCLGNTDDCTLFQGLGAITETPITSNPLTCADNGGNACSRQVNGRTLSAVYFIYTVESGSGPNKLRIPNGYQWCVGAFFDFKEKGTKTRRILCGFTELDPQAASGGLASNVIQYAMLTRMGDAVDSGKQQVEACFTRECGLDTKVSDFRALPSLPFSILPRRHAHTFVAQ